VIEQAPSATRCSAVHQRTLQKNLDPVCFLTTALCCPTPWRQFAVSRFPKRKQHPRWRSNHGSYFQSSSRNPPNPNVGCQTHNFARKILEPPFKVNVIRRASLARRDTSNQSNAGSGSRSLLVRADAYRVRRDVDATHLKRPRTLCMAGRYITSLRNPSLLESVPHSILWTALTRIWNSSPARPLNKLCNEAVCPSSSWPTPPISTSIVSKPV
jgi:hypothetical protein